MVRSPGFIRDWLAGTSYRCARVAQARCTCESAVASDWTPRNCDPPKTQGGGDGLSSLGYVCIQSVDLIGIDDLGSNDLDLIQRAIVTVCLDQTQSLNQLEARFDAAEDGMFAVQPGSRGQSDEELAAVGVLAAVGHAEDSGARVFQRRVDLVFKLVPVDACPSAPRPRRVARLDHEVRDDSVEDDAVVVVSLRQRRKVLARLGRVFVVQFYRDGTLDAGRCVRTVVGEEKKAMTFLHLGIGVGGRCLLRKLTIEVSSTTSVAMVVRNH